MHHISFETTRLLIEQHHRELLQEADARRIARRVRHSTPKPQRTHRPPTEPPGSPVLASVRGWLLSRRRLAGPAIGTP